MESQESFQEEPSVNIRHVTDLLQVIGDGKYLTVEVNSSDIILEGKANFLAVRKNKGKVVLAGSHSVLVVQQNRGAIELIGANNELRVLRQEDCGSVSVLKGSSTKLNGVLVRGPGEEKDSLDPFRKTSSPDWAGSNRELLVRRSKSPAEAGGAPEDPNAPRLSVLKGDPFGELHTQSLARFEVAEERRDSVQSSTSRNPRHFVRRAVFSKETQGRPQQSGRPRGADAGEEGEVPETKQLAADEEESALSLADRLCLPASPPLELASPREERFEQSAGESSPLRESLKQHQTDARFSAPITERSLQRSSEPRAAVRQGQAAPVAVLLAPQFVPRGPRAEAPVQDHRIYLASSFQIDAPPPPPAREPPRSQAAPRVQQGEAANGIRRPASFAPHPPEPSFMGASLQAQRDARPQRAPGYEARVPPGLRGPGSQSVALLARCCRCRGTIDRSAPTSTFIPCHHSFHPACLGLHQGACPACPRRPDAHLPAEPRPFARVGPSLFK